MLKKTIFVNEILTKSELKRAKKLYDVVGIHKFARECSRKIITPVIDRINDQLGQVNDPINLAYAVEYSLLKGKGTTNAHKGFLSTRTASSRFN